MARKETFKSLEKVVDESGRCFVASGNERCWFPGTLGGGGGWICRLHYGCPPGMVIPVIEESKRWYEKSRQGLPVPETYKRFDGVEVPGFRTKWSNFDVRDKKLESAGG